MPAIQVNFQMAAFLRSKTRTLLAQPALELIAIDEDVPYASGKREHNISVIFVKDKTSRSVNFSQADGLQKKETVRHNAKRAMCIFADYFSKD